MELFTMVITMCVSGQSACTTQNVRRPEFTSEAMCEQSIDTVTRARTKELGQNPALKGKSVTYDVTCFSHSQFVASFGNEQHI